MLSNASHNAAALMLAALAAAAAAPVAAQREPDAAPAAAPALAEPPPVDGGPAAVAAERPGAARIADPPIREEVVVVGENRWRLPDLGSSWRDAGDREPARIRTSFFQLYDPEDPTNRVNPFPVNSEVSRVGFIELVRLRFGRR